MYVSQLSTKPSVKVGSRFYNSPTVVPVQGSGPDKVFEGHEVYLSVEAFNKKAEDIMLKIKVRGGADPKETKSGFAIRKSLLTNNKGGLVQGGTALQANILSLFQKGIANLQTTKENDVNVNKTEIKIKTQSLKVFKEYIDRKVAVLVDDENKREEYDQLLANIKVQNLKNALGKSNIQIVTSKHGASCGKVPEEAKHSIFSEPSKSASPTNTSQAPAALGMAGGLGGMFANVF